MRLPILILIGLSFLGCGSKNENRESSTLLVKLAADSHYVQKFGYDLAQEHPDLMLDYKDSKAIPAERLENFCNDLASHVSASGDKMVPAVLRLQGRRISYCEIAGKGTTLANCARNVRITNSTLSYMSPQQMEVSAKLQQEGAIIFLKQTTIDGQSAVLPNGTDELVGMLDPEFKALQYAVYACLNKP